MRVVTIDLETYSEVNVKDVGAEAYARHPSTDIICLYWSVGGEPQGWAPGYPFPPGLATAIGMGYIFDAHNVAFERAIWRFVGPRYGFPPIPDDAWRCTMAACAYRGVALKLEKAAQMLRLEQQKDMPGNAAMRYLSTPGKKGRREDLARFDACAAYCAQDVRTEIAIRRKVGDLPPDELKVWQLDQRINQRGVLIDQELCRAAIDVAQQIGARLGKEFADLTGGLAPTQRDKVLAWLNKNLPGALAIDNLTADEVQAWLDGSLAPPHVRRALEIRQQIAKSSVKKYQAALACLCPDGRARGMLQYHGAATGRWAGRLVQPQNMPRPAAEHIAMEDLCALIKSRDVEALEMIYGDPMTALADACRGMIIPAPGHVLAAYDFSSIEAVVLAGLSGEEWKLEAFRRKEDVYCLFAGVVYGHKVTKKEHPDKRQTGKIGELAFGYQGGVAAWRKFDSTDRHTDEQVDEYKKLWRGKHPGVAALWRGLNDAALLAVHTNEPQEYAGFRYEVEGDWLSCRLLSGRKLWYLHPRVALADMPWRDDDGEPAQRPQVHFTAYKEGQIKTVRGYGGHWTENVDQALSRDIMVGAMFRTEKAGFPLILTVHDEMVAEVPERDAERAAKEIPALMAEPLPWSQGWPIRAEGSILTRYSK